MIVALMLSVSAAQAQDRLRIVVLGDSLVAGYGLEPAQAFPAKLQAALSARGHDVEIINAGVSGDTSAGGLARLDWSVPDGVDGVVVELGANDALRGVPPRQTRDNLDDIITRLKERGMVVMLAGMMAPPNMGPDYGEAFNAIYPALAEEHGIRLYPFFLEGVAAVPELNQDDAMHPNARGIDVMVRNFLPHMLEWIDTIEGSSQAVAQ